MSSTAFADMSSAISIWSVGEQLQNASEAIYWNVMCILIDVAPGKKYFTAFGAFLLLEANKDAVMCLAQADGTFDCFY